MRTSDIGMTVKVMDNETIHLQTMAADVTAYTSGRRQSYATDSSSDKSIPNQGESLLDFTGLQVRAKSLGHSSDKSPYGTNSEQREKVVSAHRRAQIGRSAESFAFQCLTQTVNSTAAESKHGKIQFIDRKSERSHFAACLG